MKHFFPFLALSLALVALTSCDPKDEPQPEPIPASFPKKHLIEEFTGQTCGYCPYGMNCIHDFMENDTNFILVLHHYGYQQDHFTVAGSKTITNKLKVDGAPAMTINRAKTTYKEGSRTQSAVVFHPANLTDTDKSQFDKTTYASVNLKNSYNPSTRELTVTVSGALCTKDYPALSLTVLIKESGMIDTQADYEYSFEGWKEFRHTNAVRLFLSNALGDDLYVDTTRHYKAEYTCTLKSAWVPENCMVVAFLSEEFQPVVQAAQKPVVAGSKGGADIRHGGITPVPVPDYYPEPNATSGPSDYSRRDKETLTTCTAIYQQFPSDDVTYWSLQAYSPESSVIINKTQCVPFATFYLLAPYSATPTLPTGIFPINSSYEIGSVIAGYRDDEQMVLNGSMFYFVNQSYLKQGYLVPVLQWLMAEGSFTITEEGWSIDGKALNGSDIHLEGEPFEIYSSSSAPARLKKQMMDLSEQE